MNIKFEAQLLEKLGFSVRPDNLTDSSIGNNHGWVVTHPQWDHERQCDSRADMAKWLYSRGVSLYPQYLAILRFREILSSADGEVIDGLRSWCEGSRVRGAAEVVVDEVLRVSRQEVVLTTKDWRSLALEILSPHMQRRYLPLGTHMGLELDAFLSARALDSKRSKGIVCDLWKRGAEWISKIGLSLLWACRKTLGRQSS
ncbi:hypothetical protein [Xanthomonas hortorum]|uniref:Uncharacterized protein n=1 Tax=Xanthomonas hortorum pv. carotae TaxID=487904 RepID=A0A6V7EYF7_9XANT|nr:hypothetical protein [Xanthomonas hortorum]CAD0356290.1 hypothetical protein CFBP7900_28390 [Xanthomonas hortorum pv. carotae]CAD0356296.1 hypothetical protein CFBP7900_28390 [Xanthomonas hortorum pv. carotae]